MNERIGQLAERARLIGPSSRIGNSHEATEEFAKLIIKECAQELSRVPGGYDSSVFYKNSKILKEHFGVEQ